MAKLYIRGLVRTANAIRRELAQPLSAERKERVRQTVDESVRQVDAILARNAATLRDVPAPTQRAYDFLKNVDLDAPSAQPAAGPDSRVPGAVSLVGLKSDWDAIIRRLAQPVDAEEAEVLHSSIATSSANVEQQLGKSGLDSVDLTAQSRAARGWLAFFADRENFDAYRDAITRARPGFDAALAKSRRFHPPGWLEFRPIPGLFKLRGYRDGTRIALPTPMISFSDRLFQAIVEAAFFGGSKEPIVHATMGDEYQSTQAELEALCGMEERAAGVHHDLRASFDRTNTRYFGGDLARPRLTWSRTFTGRKFGHCDPIRDTVMISSTLDHADVPAFVVDFVMYHELLHKKLGVDWRNGRQAVHTPEFKAQERHFEQYVEAEAALKRLAVMLR